MLKRLLFYNFHVIYRLSQWLRFRFTPVGLLLIATTIGAGIFGIDTRRTLAFQVFSLSAGLLLVAIAGGIHFRSRFQLLRLTPQFGTVGLPLRYQLRIKNLGGRRERDLLLIDELDSGFPSYSQFRRARDPEDARRNWFDRAVGYPRLMALMHHRRGAAIPPRPVADLMPDDDMKVAMEFVPLRRGYLRFARSRVTRVDPLGVFRAMKTIPSPGSLLILPRIYRVPAIRQTGRRRYQHGEMNMASAVGDSQEFFSLRDYKPGDPLRAVHWRSFAKRGKPVVKEFHDEFFVRQGLILDTFLADRSSDIFEEAVSVAASFALASRDQDSLLDLMFVGTSTYRFTTGRGLAGADNMVEILACVEPCADKPFSHLHELVMRHAGDTSGLICVLLDWDRQRQRLIGDLLRLQIPVFTLVLADTTLDFDADENGFSIDPRRLVALPLGDIQKTLDGIDSRHGIFDD